MDTRERRNDRLAPPPASTPEPDRRARSRAPATVLAALAVLVAAVALLPAGVRSDLASVYHRRFLTARESAFAMGTHVTIAVEGRGAARAARAAVDRVLEVDRRLGPSGEESGPAALAAAGGAPVAVSDDMLDVLEIASDIVALSGGAFDPSLGALVNLWGFGPAEAGDPRVPPSSKSLAQALALSGWEHVTWDREARTARVEAAGMSLALGGIAKGYALDAAAVVLREAGITRAVIDGGGDLYLLGRRADGRSWRIAVRHPRQPGYLGVVELPPDTAIATSGDYERFFIHDGERYHHLLDPSTGRPARRCVSVTVIGPSAALADALATAVFVLGPDEGLALIDRLPDYEALIVTPDGLTRMTAGMGLLLTDGPASSEVDPAAGAATFPLAVPERTATWGRPSW